MRIVTDVDLEEAMTPLAVDMSEVNMSMSAILLQLIHMTPLVQKKAIIPTLLIPNAVAVMDMVSDVGPIQTTALDSLGHW